MKKISSFNKCLKSSLPEEKVRDIFDFITLKGELIKTIGGEQKGYIAFGDRKNRCHRINVRPLILYDDKYVFSPVLMNYVRESWLNGLQSAMPPYCIGLDNIVNVVDWWKKKSEIQMVDDLYKSFCSYNLDSVQKNLELFKYDKKHRHPRDIGDYDIFAVDTENKLVWNIECKVLKLVHMWYILHCKEVARPERTIKHQMLHAQYLRPEIMNMGSKFQKSNLENCFVCKNETGRMGARHVRI